VCRNRDEEALQEQARANQISGFERPWALGLLYIHLRRYDDAINELRSRSTTMQQDAISRYFLSRAYWLKGMWKESEHELEETARLTGDSRTAEAEHRAFQKGGERALEQFGVDAVLKQSRKQYISAFTIAEQYALLGDREHTLKYLELAYRERAPWMPFLQREPIFDFLHSDDRYRLLIKKIGLPAANESAN
jgi:tetratricopeptide (TPR) repeat protein